MCVTLTEKHMPGGAINLGDPLYVYILGLYTDGENGILAYIGDYSEDLTTLTSAAR